MSTKIKRFRNRTNHSMCIFIEDLFLVNSLKVFIKGLCELLFVTSYICPQLQIGQVLSNERFTQESLFVTALIFFQGYHTIN